MMTSATQELVSPKDVSPGLQESSSNPGESSPFSRPLPGINIDNCDNLKVKNSIPFKVSPATPQPIQSGSLNFGIHNKGLKSSFTHIPCFDPSSAGVSSINNSSNPAIQRIPPGLSSSFGGWVSSNDIWKSDYPPSSEFPSSPNFPREEGSYNSNLHSHHDSFLSRAGSIPSESLSGYTRTRTTTGSEFRFGLRNPLACLNQESGMLDRRLSTSMSPMFGIPVDRSPMFRGYVGSPHSNSSYIQPGSESEASFKFNPGDYYRAGFARRMSLTPNFGPFAPLDDLTAQMETLTMEEYTHILNRRHSVAASAFPIRKPPQHEPEAIRLNTLEENYDEQTEQFTLELDIPDSAPCYQETHKPKDTYYVVEFKIKRTDAFYIAPEYSTPVKIGDRVIVQGDRGKDLGVVIRDAITIEEYKKEFGHFAAGPDGSQSNKEVEPKKIYRLAQPHEIALLPAKAEDEAKALDLVREKTAQRDFFMKVVDAEYQWDRRKLTFYFISDRRIDFRDLVRELFKIYKTRIWMCAVTR